MVKFREYLEEQESFVNLGDVQSELTKIFPMLNKVKNSIIFKGRTRTTLQKLHPELGGKYKGISQKIDSAEDAILNTWFHLEDIMSSITDLQKKKISVASKAALTRLGHGG